MAGSDKARDPIPERFESLAEAADFWDDHDVAEYDDLTSEAHFEVELGRQRFLTALGEPGSSCAPRETGEPVSG